MNTEDVENELNVLRIEAISDYSDFKHFSISSIFFQWLQYVFIATAQLHPSLYYTANFVYILKNNLGNGKECNSALVLKFWRWY